MIVYDYDYLTSQVGVLLNQQLRSILESVLFGYFENIFVHFLFRNC